MTNDTISFRTCDGCRRNLRTGMFFDVRTEETIEVCRCCTYQALLAKNSGSSRPTSKWWRSAVGMNFKK
ncbi:hypothetical protein ANO14919_047520 [Xylariales sp. No.14919]|nr:hypothetical protein ANO14919_047520 [Xylariales sp. No.14919]